MSRRLSFGASFAQALLAGQPITNLLQTAGLRRACRQ